MKNNKLTKILVTALSCLLLVGVVFGITVMADGDEPAAATVVEIDYKNVSYAGAPALVFYVGTDAPLADNQKVKVFFWEEKNIDGIYNEYSANDIKVADNSVIIDGDKYYTVIADGTAPSELRKSIIARPALVETDENGKETVTAMGEVLEYSIFDYAIDMFAADDGASEDQITIYRALLDYAASVQTALFTNPHNGVVSETKLNAAGGWADAYYVIQLNRHIYNSKTGLFEDNGDPIRYYHRVKGEERVFDNGFFYDYKGTTYAFKGYRDANGNYLTKLAEKVNGYQLTQSSTYINGYTTKADKLGVTEYIANYGVVTGSLVNYDDGQSLKDLSGNYTNFLKQYGISTSYTKDKAATANINRYFYQPDLDKPKVEIQYFFTENGAKTPNFSDYHYAAIKTSDKTLVNTDKEAGNVVANPANYTFIDIDNGAASGVTKETVEMTVRGYNDLVADPAGGDRGNAHLVLKHAYDVNDPDKTPYTLITQYGNSQGGGFATSGYVIMYGSLTPTADGTKANPIISNVDSYITVNTPAAVITAANPAVHVYDTDVYVSSTATSGSLMQIMMNTGSKDLIKLNLGCDSGEDQFYLFMESGTLGASSGTRFKADGTSISTNVLGGTRSGTTVGKSLLRDTWYNLRIEYVAFDTDTALVLFYIDGELVSYINGSTTVDDSLYKKVSFFIPTNMRESYVYFDNTYVATEGSYAVEAPEGDDDAPASDIEFYEKIYTYGDGDYHGKGENFELSHKMEEKGHAPADGLGKNILQSERLSDGTPNTALYMLKNDTGGRNANYAALDTGGQLYYVELDLKVIDSENHSGWCFKFSFANGNITGASDTEEFGTLCIMIKDGYWTISTMNAPLSEDFKFKLDQWHHLKFLIDPSTNTITIWMNDVKDPIFQKAKFYSDNASKPDTSYAGIRLNVRGGQGDGGKTPCSYTELYFDNVFTTTYYQDYVGKGQNNANSNKYDDAPALGEGAAYETDGFVSATDYNFVTAPSHNRGHEYIYETDIKWNGATGSADAGVTNAKVFALKMFSDLDEIFSINGYTTNVEKAPLMLKIGTNSVGTVVNGYWMNLRVVYKPLENTEVEGVTMYNAEYTIYINNIAVYTATISSETDLGNSTFNRVELTVKSDEEGVVPSIYIDNTYTAAVYVDNYKKGNNYASADKYIDAENKDGDLTVNGTFVKNTESTIGSKHYLETDFKWVRDNATISLIGVDGNAVFTVYVLADATDAGYAKLSLTENIEDAFFTVRENVWYNIAITATEGSYSVSVSGKVRTTSERAISETYYGMAIASDGGMVIDNTYVSISNSDYAGKGANKDGVIADYTKDNKIKYDAILGEADPNNAYTDAYITVSKAQIIMGKKTATSHNSITFGGGSRGSNHIFETDLKWAGTEFGSVSGNSAPYFTVTVKGADGAELLTIYAAGVYYVDTVATQVQFVKLYASLEDMAEDKYFAYVAADVAFNLRVEYSASGEYKIFVNNNECKSGTGVESASMSGVDIKLGDDIYDTKLTIKNTYIATK